MFIHKLGLSDFVYVTLLSYYFSDSFYSVGSTAYSRMCIIIFTCRVCMVFSPGLDHYNFSLPWSCWSGARAQQSCQPVCVPAAPSLSLAAAAALTHASPVDSRTAVRGWGGYGRDGGR